MCMNYNNRVVVFEFEIFETNFHRICEAQTLENSLNVGLRTGYLSVRAAGGASERH